MAKNPNPEDAGIHSLSEQIKDIQDRLAKLEKQVSVLSAGTSRSVTADQSGSYDELPEFIPGGLKNEHLESRIGEHGMAWLGNIVLLFGIIFIIQLLDSRGLKLVSVFSGLIAVAGSYLLGSRLKIHFPVMSTLFNYTGHILLFFVAMKLHYFSSDPLLESNLAGFIPPVLAIGGLGYISYRNKSQALAGIVMIMVVLLAIFTNSTHLMLSLLVILAGASLLQSARSGWWTILILSIFLVYITYVIWLMNNPFINQKVQAVKDHQFSYIYLFIFAFIYSMFALWRSGKKIPAGIINSSIVINGLGFTLTISLVILTFFKENYVLILGMISAFCMVYAFVLQWRGDWKLAAALYALYGFAVLSITVSVIYKFPLAFLLLSIQSLLVVSMALWFRSRFIVVMNMTLFIGLLGAYLIAFDSIHSVNFSFAIVALVTARVINWKKKRLEIQTEFLRNIYLLAGFIMTLVSLYKAVPDKYITLSWTGAALLFFLLSIILSNVKYRWLAISAMIVSAIHLFLFDLKNISLGYRIIALLFLAIISLGISIFYARRLRTRKEQE